MPQLSDPRHEIFANQVAGRASYAKAAVRAGYASGPSANTGSRLAKRPEIQARIEELKSLPESPIDGSKEPSEVFISKANVIQQVVALQELSSKQKQYSVALGCLRYLGELGGLLPDKNSRLVQNSPKTLNQFNISTMTSRDIGNSLRSMLGDLPPEERKKLMAAIPEVTDIDLAEPDSAPLTPQSES